MRNNVDVLIIGAGAAGMMCAIEAGRRGRSVLIIDHASAPGEKIRISGGGRCNFTNLHAAPANYLGSNPHFCISALRRYTQRDFIALVDRHGIAWHEKTLGQLFCDGSARQIITMLVDEMRGAGVEMRLGTTVRAIHQDGEGYRVELEGQSVRCRSLVIACGGKSIPKMGATGFGYEIAGQFGLKVTETRPALVPLTFNDQTLAALKPLSGIGVDATVTHGSTTFSEAMLFTHRGLSGPAILQISSYWREGDVVSVDLLPGRDVFSILKTARGRNGKQAVQTVLGDHLPKRLAQHIAETSVPDKALADLPDKQLMLVASAVHRWQVKPAGSEGYRTAEVTLGGVNTDQLDQKTMEVRSRKGLYFIGEVVDVTGWLGGYNFQWAWSSGWAAGQAA
ncbi:NAD(P)/FAD-dependent oxidoreductase [Phyllobacterium sp. 0TCS1.6C]|uniref:NAD(P)/FAD-dependent oxidoreductase n=1 Tax=unclassified Phyllobacterium TaxID=2638441 RepID=UPI00226475BF|nr:MULTISPECIES: NAD(P)/FAD-dependent oxidoreductase [unclassified Phyllobacterium]MCX8281744.1 NAD(P)/FAD-dependent oxidoreductase [Phyllobacterium sp. 0TCS1.6C]MCX8294854.1 NAD(P)/FAD-dependent oxidoreductase [Phyllobacterium sp. 0TCS1.6A]